MTHTSPENGEAHADATEADETRDVTLPARLVSRAERRLEYTTYESVDEYVAVVLRETLARVEAETDEQPADVDSDEVQDRLESLGYLDS